VVNKDSPYYELSDLKGKLVSVPFGSAAHGMVLKAMQDRGLPSDFFQLVSQSPEVGSTNLQEKKIDAHADFVPFAELLPFRGFARKIFDGVETNLPTWHGVVVRTDFAEKYPEVVVAYIKAIIAANQWLRADPKLAAEKIQEWTGTNKEVVYIFLGPSGNMTTDPTIKPALIDAAAADVKVLQNLGRMKDFDPKKWVDDSYVRKAYAEMKLDYDAELASTKNYEISGEDKFCKKPITDPHKSGEVWVDGEGILPFSSAMCTLGAYADYKAKGKKIDVTYVFDTARGIKLFADQAFFAVGGGDIAPFLLKKDAEAWAAKNNGKVLGFDEAVKAATNGGKT
jgi:NitT/TauT family transport system substrate-binding protein